MSNSLGEHFNPTEEITLEVVKRRAVSGVIALTTRTFFLQAVTFVATFALTVYLDPAEYGIFFLVSAVINFFAYFSDIGLAAALIQKKEKPSEEDLRTTFTVQQAIVVSLLVIIFFATPFVRNYYNLSVDGVYLLWALGLGLLLSSLKTIPSVLLERHLDFNKLVISQIAETVLFNIVAVYLAWQGFGIAAFTYAVIVRGFIGTILIYILKPWLPGFAFSKKSLRSLLKFGLPYQANTFLAVAKDDGMTAVLGGILGPAGIGLLGWAQKWAFAPLRFFMDQVIKVTFPAYSRMQDNKSELSRAVSRSILFVCLLVFPSLLGLLLVAPILVQIIPKYEKWQPALFALGLFGINAVFAAVTTPLTNLLNSIGKIKITFKLMVMWTTLTWILTPFLAIKYGVNGAAGASAIIGISSIIAILIVRKYVEFDFKGSVGKPFIATAIMGIIVYLLRSMLPIISITVLLIVLTGAITYSVLIYFMIGPSILEDAKKIIYAFKKKS